MKKIWLFLISALILPVSTYAAVGDIAGDVYETDIKTYIFDEQINAYNIGGKTVILCEDLVDYYGFYLDWYPERRRLEIRDEWLKSHYSENKETYVRDISADIARLPIDYFDLPAPEHIYETDIVTTFNEQAIQGYNVNGKTAVIAEDLRDYGYNVIWNETDRTLKIYENFDNVVLETDIGRGYADSHPSKYNVECARNSQRGIKLMTSDSEITVNSFNIGEFYYAYMLPVKETFDFLNIKYVFEDNVLILDTSEAKPFKSDYIGIEQADFLGDNKIDYLYVEKVLLNGEDSEVTYNYISGHFDRTSKGKAKAKPYVCNGTVYINLDYISDLCNYATYEKIEEYVKENYNVTDIISNEKYTAFMDREKRCVVSVNRYGECTIVEDIPYYDENSTLKFEFTSENNLRINVSPFGGMRGMNSIDVDIDFSRYEFEKLKI